MDTTTLLEHREFVLHVARALLRDEADAQDAVQDTYVAAMQSAPPRQGKVRPWLGGIVRNIARNRRRSELRRVSREAQAARPDSVSGAAESSERLAWQQRVVEAVLALEPKYRDVLVLRFYDDLPPREVATRLGIPVNTVRTRTRRAIEQIRGVFDTKYGGRKAWSAAVAGLVLVPAAASAGISKLAVAATLLVVTGATVGLLHVATRDEPVTPARVALGTERGAPDGTAAGERKEAAGESGAQAGKPVPTHFRGQFLDAATKQPLAGAEVVFGTRNMERTLATAVTDEQGRFALRWNRSWKLGNTETQAFVICARKDRRWSDPFYPTRDGLDAPDGMRTTVELVDNPRFEFVVGAGRQPVAGARLSLFMPPREFEMEPGAPLSTAVSDAQGMVASEWPSWLGTAVVRLKRPNGDVLQWRMLLTQARTYDPYDIALDENELGTVRMQVLEEDGSQAGAGVRVFARGSWAPDGVVETHNSWRAPGAEPVPLMGTTDKDGVATFRFPADRAREGFYIPSWMIAFRMRSGLPEHATWSYSGEMPPEDQVARTGCALPALRFGVHAGRRPMVAVRGLDRFGEFELHGRVGKGPARQLPFDFDSILCVGGFTLLGFRDGDGGPPREREEVSAVLFEDDAGFRTTHLSAAEFARCLRGEAVIDLGAVQKARTITIRAPSGVEAYDIRLEAVAQPLLFLAGFDSDGSTTIDLPDVAGGWRVRLDDDPSAIAVIDPRAKSEFQLTPP